jgi:uncharacterized protein (DUF2267 family)
MEYREFLGRIRERAGLADDEQALRACLATLETLSERLSGGEAKDFLSQLPEPIKHSVPAVEKSYTYDLNGFIHRVSELEGTDPETAREHARAVLEVLREAISQGELKDLQSQLPKEYEPLIPGAGQHPAPG